VRTTSLRRHLLLLLAAALLAGLALAPGAGAQAIPGVSEDCAFPVLVNTTDLTYGCAGDVDLEPGATGTGAVTQRCSSVRGATALTARGTRCSTARGVASGRRGRSRYRHSGFSCRTGSRRRVTCRRPATATGEAARITFRARA